MLRAYGPFLLIALAAAASGGVTVLLLPEKAAELGLLIAALVFIGGAVLQDLIDRSANSRALERRLERLERQNEALAARLSVLEDGGGPSAKPAVPRDTPQQPATLAASRLPNDTGRSTKAAPRASATQPVTQDDFGRLPDMPKPGPGDHARIRELLVDAVREDRLVAYRQPIVTLPQRRYRFVELFSRVRTPDGSLLRAAHYVEIAKREALIGACDNLLLLRAIQLARTLYDNQEPLGIFCNVAADTLMDPAFREEMSGFVGEHPAIAKRLVLEIDFGELKKLARARQEVLGGMAEQGVRFSLGQLGDERPDMIPLDTIPMHFIKMPAASLIALIEGRGVDAAEEMKASLAERGIALIVEKIESERQLVEVLDVNVEYGQGYLFGEPEPFETVPEDRR